MRRWRNWPWATKLAVLLAAFAVAPLAVVTINDEALVRGELLAAARAQNLQRARGTAEALDTHLAELADDLRLVAVAADTVRFIARPDDPELRRQAELSLRQIVDSGGLAAVALTDRSGRVLLSTDGHAAGRDLSDLITTSSFLRAIAGQSGVDEPRWDPVDRQVLLRVFTPVHHGDGRLLGTAIGRASLADIDRILASDTDFAGRRELGVLWDWQGLRLSQPSDPAGRFRPLEPLPPHVRQELVAEGRFGPATAGLLDAPAGLDGIVERSRWLFDDRDHEPAFRIVAGGTEAFHGALAPLAGKRWVYGVFTPEEALLATQRRRVRGSVAIALATAVLALLVALAAARWASRPLRLVSQAAAALASGDLGRRVGLARDDEVGRVATAFDAMAGALEAKDAELRAHAEELERRIEERTATLRASEAELRALFAAMSDDILVLDAAGTILRVAPTSSEASTAAAAADLTGRRLAEIFPPAQAEELRRYLERALAARRPVKVEYRGPGRPAGGEGWYEASISPLLDDTVLWVARDISRRKHDEEERRALLRREQEERRRAEEANRIKDEFLATALPRAAHAAQRHPRLGLGAARRHARRGRRAAGAAGGRAQRAGAEPDHRRPARRLAHHHRQAPPEGAAAGPGEDPRGGGGHRAAGGRRQGRSCSTSISTAAVAGPRRPRPAAAGGLEPALERGEVHPRRRARRAAAGARRP